MTKWNIQSSEVSNEEKSETGMKHNTSDRFRVELRKQKETRMYNPNSKCINLKEESRVQTFHDD